MQYTMENGKTSSSNQKGETFSVANFEARIVEEQKFIDGREVTRNYIIQGIVNGKKQDLITVPADDFAGMAWPQSNWGSQAIVYPQNGAKEIMRAAIQIESSPKITSIYTHTGWVKIKDKPHYLAANCAIGAEKRVTNINVLLPRDLRRFKFPELAENTNEALIASLQMTQVVPAEIGWAIIGTIYRAPLGGSDFALHISGRTGTYKSEIAALVQSHWGECNARELPASWASTANALEALAYRAKDAVLTCDDFIPSGTSWQQRTYQKTADQLIRAQGNQAGRARLTDRSMLQQTMYPRGVILSTGEDTPEGHSVRARMLIAELSPGDIATGELTKAQAARPRYSEAMAGYLGWLADGLDEKKDFARKMSMEIRDKHLDIGHSRTPSTIGQVMAGIYMVLLYADESKAIPTEQTNRLYENAYANVLALAGRQQEYLVSADPADQFLSTLRGILAAKAGHLRAPNGGIPRNAELLGWTMIGEPPSHEYKPHGATLGWAAANENIAYLDAAVAYDTIRRHSRGTVTISRQTLYKRLRESGHLVKIDSGRQRNTVRVQLQNATRQTLAVRLETILEGDLNA